MTFGKHEREYMKENVDRGMVETSVGSHSLVGIIGDPPYSHGYYFNFAGGPRCVNMWMENMSHLVETGVLGGDIEVEV